MKKYFIVFAVLCLFVRQATLSAEAACDDPAALISAIQGNGSASPLVGQIVSIEGIVVGDFQNDNGINGFFVQEEATDADNDPASSEGIFVFEGPSTVAVAIGDKVRVNGEVAEFFGLTELTSINSVEICSSNNTVAPTTLSLPFSSSGFPEQFEGMLIDLGSGLSVTETFNQGRFGELLLANGRLFQPTHLAEPGMAANALAAANALNQIILDDARTAQNPDPLINPDGSIFDDSNTVRSGSRISGTAVMYYSFGSYRLQPVNLSINDANPRTATPADVGGKLKIAAFNLQNYFTTLDTSGPICGPNANLDCRGADSASEFIRQRDKIIAALTAIDADIVGLIEIENNATLSLQDLVNGLGGDYAFINTGTIGTDAIKVGFIYKSTMVSPVGDFAVLDSSVDATFIDTKNRPALAQTFQEIASGERLTLAVNHLKSKGSDCNNNNDPDIGDGQGNCNLTRTSAATALANWLASDPTGSGDPDFMILGDLNAYRMEDPIAALKNAGYIDLIDARLNTDAYSFVFSGQYGYLDYALVNASLNSQVTGITEWHINSDEPPVIGYNEEFKSTAQISGYYTPDAYRASDHDPIIIGLTLATLPEDNIFESSFE